MMGANPQASDHVQMNDVPSTCKESTASDTWKTPGEIMTPGIGIKTGRNLFPFRPHTEPALSALFWAGPVANIDRAFSWVRFKLIEFSSFP